ncbi:hypothetical protein [Xanthomonas bundabergensis]|uniref:hypothetical protein n=1 Tax=Xanthomonas bundabergensis TaxID=3160842 RepID=UPI003514D5B9
MGLPSPAPTATSSGIARWAGSHCASIICANIHSASQVVAMPQPLSEEDLQTEHERAYASFDAGQLEQAAQHFATLLAHAPDARYYHYMQGLVHKYLLDWPRSLHHNLRALALAEDADASAQWNAGIAATAIGDWAQARAQWAACGIGVPEGDGPIDADFGVVSVRLNPWSNGETLFARRIDVVRARLLNVPLPESGHRYGDIVLHDGAATGRRAFRDRTVPVFNALARLQPSPLQTFTVFAHCPSPDDRDALRDAPASDEIALIEDWSETLVNYCLRCSYGAATHPHPNAPTGTWKSDRDFGVAAAQRSSLDAWLQHWQAGAAGRRIDAVEIHEISPPVRQDGMAWWISPDDAADDGKAEDS